MCTQLRAADSGVGARREYPTYLLLVLVMQILQDQEIAVALYTPNTTKQNAFEFNSNKFKTLTNQLIADRIMLNQN